MANFLTAHVSVFLNTYNANNITNIDTINGVTNIDTINNNTNINSIKHDQHQHPLTLLPNSSALSALQSAGFTH